MTWRPKAAGKPASIYKTTSRESSCAECAYRDANYCAMRKVKLDVFTLPVRRCRDQMHEERGVPFNQFPDCQG
jgi:hypothetical protein